jgi:hypothetical protein
MSEENTVKLTDPNHVPVIFVNDVTGIGFLNGVINLTLSTALFTPQGSQVETDLVVASRLRMDLFCAQQLHGLLGKIIEENTKGPAQTPPKPH